MASISASNYRFAEARATFECPFLAPVSEKRGERPGSRTPNPRIKRSLIPRTLNSGRKSRTSFRYLSQGCGLG